MVVLCDDHRYDYVVVKGDASKPLPCRLVVFQDWQDARDGLNYYAGKIEGRYSYSDQGARVPWPYWLIRRADFNRLQIIENSDPEWGPVTP